MFRHHRILYRRLLRGQSSEELLALRGESALFPTLITLIDDELQRRAAAMKQPVQPGGVRSLDPRRPFSGSGQHSAALS